MNDDLTECERCGEMFPDDEIEHTFVWCVCYECKADHGRTY